MSWTLAEAKADLETVASRAREEGPQEIMASDGTRFRLSVVQVEHGEPGHGDKPTLIEYLLAAPRETFEFDLPDLSREPWAEPETKLFDENDA